MPRRGENIRKKKDGKWEGRVKIGNNAKCQTLYRSVYGKTYMDVKTKMCQANNDEENQETRELCFGEIAEIWLGGKKLSVKGATINKYQNMLEKHILPQIGKMYLSEMNGFLLNSFLEEKLKSGRIDGNGGLSTSYVGSLRLIINSIIDFSIEEGFFVGKKVKMSRPKIEQSEIVVIDKNNVAILETRLYENITATNLGVLLALQLGLRIGEICALRWCDINFQEKVLCVTHTVARIQDEGKETTKTKLILDTPKTKSSIRKIPICSKLFAAIQRIKKDSNSDFVISEKNSFLSPRTFEYRFHQTLKQLNIPQVNFHVLRHTFATMCIESGIDVKTLSELLGHSNVSITLNTYVHSSMDLKRKQLEKLYAFQG